MIFLKAVTNIFLEKKLAVNDFSKPVTNIFLEKKLAVTN